MRWRLPLAVFLLTCAVSGWVTLNAIPGFIMGKAMDRIAATGGGAGEVRHAPRLTQDNQTIVRASPDILYSVCAYDLSDGPRLLTVPWPADGNYASVSFYDANTNNFAVVSDRDAEGASATRILLQDDQSGEATPSTLPAHEARQDRLLLAPSPGLALYRRVIDANTDLAVAEAERQAFRCDRLSDQ
jgi:uncharacterized membrane protein